MNSDNQICVNGVWFTVEKGKGTVSLISKRHGRYRGERVYTMSGWAYLFSHHGHRYQGADAVETFRKLAEREL